MVDRDLILRKLADIDTYVRQLGEFRGLGVQEYRSDWKVQRIVDRTLQIAIEACVDVASHVIADRGFRVPATYAETFEVLGEQGLLPTELVGRMTRMAAFRNILVHEYTRVDPVRVIGVLKEQFDDFEAFRTAILSTLT